MAEAATSPGPVAPGDLPPDDDPDGAAMAQALSWQVVLRVRLGRPIPPMLQEWFNRFVAIGHGKRVRTAPPHVATNDRMAIELLTSYGLSQTEAKSAVAAASGRSIGAVKISKYRKGTRKNNCT